ncbi:MAG: glycosyl hydrolase [Planctomycetota bacterium]
MESTIRSVGNGRKWNRPLRAIFSQVLVVCTLIAIGSSASAVDGKRGWAGGAGDMADASNAYWYYNWWHTKPAGADQADSDWIPLVKYPNNLQAKLDIVTGYDDVDTILVLNEPEREDQSDVTVAEAISIWPQFEATGLNLITPAISDNQEGRDWLADFMSQANANNYRMDGLAFHWYGASNPNNPAGSANNFLSRVDFYWNTYGLPLWITEFAMHDWEGDNTDAEMLAANEQFLDIVLPELESRSYVEAYSFYHWFSDATLIEDVGGLWTPTNVGDSYLPSYYGGETYDVAGQVKEAERVYLRGGTLTNTGAATDVAVHTIYAVDGTSELNGSADWGVSGAGAVEINAGATLHKSGVNTAKVQGAPVNNRGLLRVSSGTFSFQGGSDLSGTGMLQLEPGGKLSLGVVTDRDGVTLGQSMELNGGTIEANTITDGTHSISSAATVNQDTTFSGNGFLFVNAPLLAPIGGGGGGITKDGNGLVLLNSPSTYEGNTVVRQGTLRLTATASIDSSPQIDVQAAGVFDVSDHAGGFMLAGQSLSVSGQVAGSINATNGAEVSVLSSSAAINGDLSVENSTVTIGGVGFNENPTVTPIVTNGLLLDFDAAADTPGDATWTNQANAANSVTFGGTASPDSVSDANFPGIEAAYDISATGIATGLNAYFEGQSPQISRKDAAFEVVFFVSDTAAGNDQVLFEVGAARGVSFMLSESSLSFNVDGDGTTNTLSTAVGVGWNHAVGVIDVVGLDDNLANDSIELFVNNVAIGTLDNLLIDDWAGGNLSGIGGNAAGTAGTAAPLDFHGKIASARFYSDVLFGSAEVAQNYDHITSLGIGDATTMHVNGDYTQMNDSTLAIDLLSPAAHDSLNITGSADLGGLLEVGEVDGFAPSAGDSFTVLTASGGLTGEFDTTALPALSGLQWLIDYSATEVTLSVIFGADFDGSGLVDGADYLIWQRGIGQSGQLDNSAGDADGNGVVDADDLAIWRSQLGTNPNAPTSAAVAVPEPNALFSACMLCAMMLIHGRRVV